VSDPFTYFVTNVYRELDYPPDYTQARISGWFLDSANVGQLNNLIGTNYTPDAVYDNNGIPTGWSINPAISGNELGIYKMLFNYNYYFHLSRSVAVSASRVGQDWVSMQEGDSKITRVNKNEISKNLRALAKDAKETLDKAVKMYLKYGAIPSQIVGDDYIGISNYISLNWDRSMTEGDYQY
jgi:hypothetical protein